jgi:hypothetical protein
MGWRADVRIATALVFIGLATVPSRSVRAQAVEGALPAKQGAKAPPAPRPAQSALDAEAGKGFHVYDAWYFLLGLGLQGPCQATATELEASVARVVAPGLWWVGAYATAGFQTLRPATRQPASDLATCFDEDLLDGATGGDAEEQWKSLPPIGYRLADGIDGKYDPRGLRFGAGLEGGWRFIGLDVGYLRNTALVSRWSEASGAPRTSDVHGIRFRLGLAVAMELFTGSTVTYGHESPRCCKKEGSPTACECKRYPVGVSMFFFYGNELYVRSYDDKKWNDGMLGLTLKVALGVPD